MKIVTLIENSTINNLSAEHGLAFHIEYGDKTYLLDAGQSELFADNAKLLGINLALVEMAFLSHAHYDHAGGFSEFVKENTRAMVYMQTTAQNGCFAEKETDLKDIGIPAEVRESLKERICYVDGDRKVAEGIYLVAHKRKDLWERGKLMHMYRQEQGKKIYDDFFHEQSLVFELPGGLVVFNSCCHGGVDLVIEEVLEAFPDKKILAMLGGFHLMGAAGPDSMRETSKQVAELGRKLANLPVERYYTGHCTGGQAFEVLKEVLGDRLERLVTGKTLKFF